MNVVVISGFHCDTQITTVNAFCFACSFVVYACDITAAFCDNSGYIFKLAGFVDKFDEQLTLSARFNQASLDDTGQDGNVNITARNQAYNLFPFDWEFITGTSGARTNGMEADDITRCAGAFCDMVAEAGYEPVIYFNQDLGYLSYELDALTDYTFWLAEYNKKPSFYYHFDLWQYTHRGTVPGIKGSVDLNLDFRTMT